MTKKPLTNVIEIDPVAQPQPVPLPRLLEPTVDLRDQFAMAALTGLVMTGRWLVDVPKRAYQIADEMMLEREK